MADVEGGAPAPEQSERPRHDVYVRLHPAASVTRTIQLLVTDDVEVMADYNADGALLGVEILDALDVTVDGRSALTDLAEARAEVERLRGRTHEIQAQEMAKRAELDALVAELRSRWSAAERWAEDFDHLRRNWVEESRSGAPFWRQSSVAARDALAGLVHERDDARAEVERLTAQRTAVLEIHHREENTAGRVSCAWCRDSYEEPWEWPCPTAKALGVDTDV